MANSNNITFQYKYKYVHADPPAYDPEWSDANVFYFLANDIQVGNKFRQHKPRRLLVIEDLGEPRTGIRLRHRKQRFYMHPEKMIRMLESG